MALKSELMAMGLPAFLAKRLGFDPLATFAAAGNSQTTATLLTANHAVVSSGSGGVILGNAEEQWFVQNGLGGNLTVYPPVGDTFSGLTLNTGLTVPTTKAVFIVPGGPSGITWEISN